MIGSILEKMKNDKVTDMNMYASPSPIFHHDYAVSSPTAMRRTNHDHHLDMANLPQSPNSPTMYEQEFFKDNCRGTFGSCGSESSILSTTPTCNDADLNPNLEFRISLDEPFEALFNGGSLDRAPDWLTLHSSQSSDWLPRPNEGDIFDMDEVFQTDKQSFMNGPTLAALNSPPAITNLHATALPQSPRQPKYEDSDSMLEVLEDIIAKDLQQNHPDQTQRNLVLQQQQELLQNAQRAVQGQLLMSQRMDLNSSNSAFMTNEMDVQFKSKTIMPVVAKINKFPPSLTHLPIQSPKKIETERQLVCAEIKMEPNDGPFLRLSPCSTPKKEAMNCPPVVSSSLGEEQNDTPIKREPSPTGSDMSVGSTEKKWEEIKQYIFEDEPRTFGNEVDNVDHPESQLAEVKNEKSEATGPTVQQEEMDSDNDIEDMDEDDEPAYDSDLESIGSPGSSSGILEDIGSSSSKKKRFFWQYNTQSKGPKGKRLCKVFSTEDPQVLHDFEDPVFDPGLNQSRYKHTGKARKGDGNDIVPNPYRLYQYGHELRKLNRFINEMTPVNELPVNIRAKTRKEKNKLASRACRLKKKAQHEAFKIKLHGLHKEHSELMMVLMSIKDEMISGQETGHFKDIDLKLDALIKTHLSSMIAGNTTEYVNAVINKVGKGDRSGGLSR